MKALGIAGLILFVLLCIAEMVKATNYNRDITAELALAANASTVELATEKMDKALAEIEDRKLTSGYTSVIYRTPTEDIGYWYKNLKTATEELHSIPPDADQLLKSNVLLKLRETILKTGESGEHVQQPSGIHKHPNNGLWLIGYLLSMGFMTVGWIYRQLY